MKLILSIFLFLISFASFGQDILNDGKAIECGTKFTSSIPGTIDGIRFYKGSDAQTYVVHLWDGTGKSLASTTLTTSATGWQVVKFPVPVPILPGAPYVVSYYSPSGNYAGVSNYFTIPVTAGFITMTGGFYLYGSGFPNTSYQQSYYYSEPVFTQFPGYGQVLHDTISIHDSLIVDGCIYKFYVSDSGGVFRDADDVTAYRAFFGVAPPHLRLKDSIPRLYRFNYSGYRITLYPSGAWIREKQIKGVWTIQDTPLY